MHLKRLLPLAVTVSISAVLALPAASLADPPAAPTITYPTNGSYTGSDFTLGAVFDSGTRLQCKLDPAPESAWGNCPGIGDGTAYTAGWNTQLHWGENAQSDLAWQGGYNNQGSEECEGYFDSDKMACWHFGFNASSDTSMAGLFSSFGLIAYGTSSGLNDCALAASWLTKTNLVFGSYDNSVGYGIAKWNVFNLDCADTTTAITAKFKDLSAGAHTLDVRAVDSAGTASSPASVTWTVGSPPSAESQTDGDGNVFINADVLEFGAKSNGSFGSVGTTPDGFHERTEPSMSHPGTNGLGFVAPANPVTKDWSNQLGDFFTPGTPYEGWRLSANGQTASNDDQNTTIEGSWDSVSSGAHSATWHSTNSWNGLDVAMTYSTPGSDQLIQGTVTLTNSSSDPVNNVAFARGVDPDNCVMDAFAGGSVSGDPYDTKNTVFSQFGVENAAVSVITAEASCNNDTLLSLSSSDPGSRVGTQRNQWARNEDPFALLNSDGSDYVIGAGEVIEGDNDINLAIPASPANNNTIAPGQTVTLHFTYSLSRPALTSLGVSEIPPPRITGRPDPFTKDTFIAATFTGSSNAWYFECKVDSFDWQVCGSPYEPSGFSDGPHHVSVREVTLDSTRGPSSSIDWTVDTQAPNAPQLSGGVVGETSSTSSTVSISGEDRARFVCSLDGAEFTYCDSPVSLTELSLGDHTLQVKQIDRAGNESSTAGVAWTVVAKPNAPVVKGAPYVATQAGWLNLTVTSDQGTTIRCAIDGGLYAPCGTLGTQPGPWQYTVALTGLNAGTHTLSAKAVTSGGTESDVTTVTWRIGVPTSNLVFGKAPTITTPRKNSGNWSLKLTVSSGADRRPASQPMTVQLSTDVNKPADNLTPPRYATYGGKVVRYATSFSWNGKQKPRWLRVGNRAGRWSNWQAIANG